MKVKNKTGIFIGQYHKGIPFLIVVYSEYYFSHFGLNIFISDTKTFLVILLIYIYT